MFRISAINKQSITYESASLTFIKYSKILWKKVCRETVIHIAKLCLKFPASSSNIRLYFLAFPKSIQNSTDVMFFANHFCYISPLRKLNYSPHQLQKK